MQKFQNKNWKTCTDISWVVILHGIKKEIKDSLQWGKRWTGIQWIEIRKRDQITG